MRTLDYLQIDQIPTAAAQPAPIQARLLAPAIVYASLAGAWMRTGVNGIEGGEYNQADLGLINASTITRPYLAGPNVDTGLVAPVRGTLAEAQWQQQIRAVQNTLPGRP